MPEIIFARGTDFEQEAVASGYFESEDQIRLAARGLERAGFVNRQRDEHGRLRLLVVRDITATDLAFAAASEQKRLEAED